MLMYQAVKMLRALTLPTTKKVQVPPRYRPTPCPVLTYAASSCTMSSTEISQYENSHAVLREVR
eukprot:3897005-Rhodomonas_salina.3